MVGVNRAAADVDGGAVHFINIEQVEGDAGSHYVGDRVGGSDFVEVDLLDVDAVDAGFGLAQLLEDGRGVGLRTRCDSRPIDQFQDGLQVAVPGGRGVGVDAELLGCDTGADRFLDFVTGSGGERVQGFNQGFRWRTRVDKRSDGHVAGDSGKGVEVGDAGHGKG